MASTGTFSALNLSSVFLSQEINEKKKGCFFALVGYLVNIDFKQCSKTFNYSPIGRISYPPPPKKTNMSPAEKPCPEGLKQKWIHPNSAAVSSRQLSTTRSLCLCPVRLSARTRQQRQKKGKYPGSAVIAGLWMRTGRRLLFMGMELHWQNTLVYHSTTQWLRPLWQTS